MIGEPEVVKGTVRRRVEATGPAGMVPGLLHMPEAANRDLPLILLGHAGGGTKDQPQWAKLAAFIARHVPAAVLCIDLPAHGERAPVHDDMRENFREIRKAILDPATAEVFLADWRASIEEVRSAPFVDTESLAYVGFSTGAVFGLPACVSLANLRAAVFGISGVPRPGGSAAFVEQMKRGGHDLEDEYTEERAQMVLEAAGQLTDTEVLMLNMTKDQIFPMDRALKLFEALPGPKRMAVWEGEHTDVPREAIELAVTFLQRVFGTGEPC